MYLHRIIRIVPLLAMAIVVTLKLMPLITSGPLFYRGYTQKAMCERGWYWTLLFVNNYTNDRVGPSNFLNLNRVNIDVLWTLVPRTYLVFIGRHANVPYLADPADSCLQMGKEGCCWYLRPHSIAVWLSFRHHGG